jgi:hypothetical protein
MPQKNIREQYRKDIIEPALMSWLDQKYKEFEKQWDLDFWTYILWDGYKVDDKPCP